MELPEMTIKERLRASFWLLVIGAFLYFAGKDLTEIMAGLALVFCIIMFTWGVKGWAEDQWYKHQLKRAMKNIK